MNKSVRNYLLISLASFVVVASLVAIFSDGKNTQEKVIETTTTSTTTTTSPAYVETDQTKLVTNPCTSLAKKTIEKYIASPVMNGPLVQTAIAPIKVCRWEENEEDFPKLGVSIILSNTYYDSLEASKIDDVSFGDKSFIVKDFVTGVGGAKCGKTIIVKSGQFTYAVGLCRDKNKLPSKKELIQLAKEVKKSLG